MGFLTIVDGLISLLNLGIGLTNKLIGVFNLAKNNLLDFNATAIQTAKNIGMPFEQSIAYTRVLTADTQKLAAAYGVTRKDIAALQDSYASATHSAALLNTVQREHLLQSQKLIGDTTNQITKTLSEMGGSTPGQKSTLEMISRMSRSGLELKSSSSAFADNLKMANRVTFASGISGIERMTALSEKLKFNLSSFEGVSNVFSEFDSAIEASAKLQQLGGLGAAYGANPLTLMFEGMNDMESMVERFTKVFQSMAVFDTSTGTGKISGQNLQIIKAQARAIGLNPEDAIKIAKNGSRANAIQGQIGNTYDQLTDDQQDFLINKSTWNEQTQRFEMNYMDKNGQMQTKDISQLSAEEIGELQKEASMTTTDAVKEASRTLVTMDERQKAFFDAVLAGLSEVLFPLLPVFFQLQKEAFMAIGAVANLAVNTIFSKDWWSMLWLEAQRYGAKALLRGFTWLLIGAVGSVTGAIGAVCAGIYKVWELVASVFSIGGKGWGEKDYSFSIGGLTDALVDSWFEDTPEIARARENSSKAWEDAKEPLANVGKTLGTIGSEVIDKIPSAMKKVSNVINNSNTAMAQHGGDITTNIAGSPNNSQVVATTQSSRIFNSSSTANYASAPSYVPYSSNSNSTTYAPRTESKVYQAVTNSDGTVSYIDNSTIVRQSRDNINDRGYEAITNTGAAQATAREHSTGEAVAQAQEQQTGTVVRAAEPTQTKINSQNTVSEVKQTSNISVDDISLNVSGAIQLQCPNGENWMIKPNELLKDFSFRRDLTNAIVRQAQYDQYGAPTGKQYVPLYGAEGSSRVLGG